MAEQKLLKTASGGIAQFDGTDTMPAANLPAVAVISPAQITADQDNYSPTGWADADLVRLNFDTGGRGITGLAAWTNTRRKTVVNMTANFGYLACEHPDSTAANRIIGICDHIIAPYGTLLIEYDATSSRVRVISNSFYPEGVMHTRGNYYSKSVGATSGSDWGTIAFGIGGGDNDVIEGAAGLPGGWQIHTSTSTTGASSLYFAKTVNNPSFFGSGHIVSSILVYINTLSDGTNTYTFSTGIVTGANSTTLNVNNSVTIQYTHGTNSGKFLGVSRDNSGSQSTVDLGVTVAVDTPYVLTVCFDKARSEARFYVDGQMAGRVTGNMPNAVAAGARTIIVKSAGSTVRDAIIATKTFFTIY